MAAMPALTTAQPRPWLTPVDQVEQGVGLQHHPQAELLAGSGLVEVAAKLHGGAWQDQGRSCKSASLRGWFSVR